MHKEGEQTSCTEDKIGIECTKYESMISKQKTIESMQLLQALNRFPYVIEFLETGF